jgi:hypothetical protein
VATRTDYCKRYQSGTLVPELVSLPLLLPKARWVVRLQGDSLALVYFLYGGFAFALGTLRYCICKPSHVRFSQA